MKIGRVQNLQVQEIGHGGILVGDDEAQAFLPHRFATGKPKIDDELQVFVYTDREGTVLATCQHPKAQVGQFAYLEVVAVERHGAYLDWGLGQDLFVPASMQFARLQVGDWVVAAVDVDEYDRLYAATRLVDYFDPNVSAIPKGQQVDLLVYARNPRGVLVVVDQRYTGIVYYDQIFQQVEIGHEVSGWVDAVREDGKLDITLQRNNMSGTRDAAAVVLEAIDAHGGMLPLHDRSDPSDIRDKLSMSKKRFKKAVGTLYKQRKVVLDERGVRRANEPHG